MQSRNHTNLYTYRVFVPHDAAEASYDVPWRQPQHVVERHDPRWSLQGYLEPVDRQSKRRHSLAADDAVANPPPRGKASSSAASSSTAAWAPRDTTAFTSSAPPPKIPPPTLP